MRIFVLFQVLLCSGAQETGTPINEMVFTAIWFSLHPSIPHNPSRTWLANSIISHVFSSFHWGTGRISQKHHLTLLSLQFLFSSQHFSFLRASSHLPEPAAQTAPPGRRWKGPPPEQRLTGGEEHSQPPPVLPPSPGLLVVVRWGHWISQTPNPQRHLSQRNISIACPVGGRHTPPTARPSHSRCPPPQRACADAPRP